MRIIMLLFLALALEAQTVAVKRRQVFATSSPGTCCTVGTAKSDEAFGPNNVTLAATTRTAGAGIFCVASWDGFTGTATFSNTTTANDTWIALDTWNDGSSFQRFATAYVKSSNGHAADTPKVTLSLTPTQVALSCLDFTGQNATTPLDAHVTGESDASTTVTSGTFSTTTANELIIAGLGKYAGAPTWSAGTIGGASATIPSGATSPFKFISLEYLLVTSTQSSITATATTSANPTALGIGVATFK